MPDRTQPVRGDARGTGVRGHVSDLAQTITRDRGVEVRLGRRMG